MREIFLKLRALPLGLLIGLVANYYAYLGSLFLLRVTPGTTIRPMFEGFYEALLVLLASVIGLPLSVLEIRRGLYTGNKRRAVLGAVGAVIILASWPLGNYWWDYFAAQRHITFEQ